MAICVKCGESYLDARYLKGRLTCLDCGKQEATEARLGWCVAQEYNKGAYQLVTDPLTTLKQTNPKRTT